ncbi:MAG: hypothetical protein N2512_11990 [Armatimonadetes bacterium]|nr:hypothetical protein [Armatimonadota bacterium]
MVKAVYLYDPEAQETANAREENYWFAYVEEILRQLGLPATAVNVRDGELLADALGTARVIFVGDARAGSFVDISCKLHTWINSGGTLIGFATDRLDETFGNAFHSVTPEPDGSFAMTALVRLSDCPLTRAILPFGLSDHTIPVFGPLRRVVPERSRVLALLVNSRGAETSFPAVTVQRVGRGLACYFAFDLAQTMWVLHKGRPVDGDYDLDGYLRLSDAIATGHLRQDVPYADMLLFLLQNLIHGTGLPMIHQLPPLAGEVADLVIFFGGDDEGLSDGSQVAASDFMRSRGLPYHINIMPDADGHFALTVAEHDHIVANGHEASLHFNFIDNFCHPIGFGEQHVERQVRLFYENFGHLPIVTVNHWCRWTGWAEPARWMATRGIKGDNSRLGLSSPPLNPVNRIGLAFGSAFPHYYYDDPGGGNQRINFLAVPGMAYEVGYLGDATDFETLHRALDLAAHFHMTANFFYHPVYIAHQESCRRAIDELVRYLREGQHRAVFMGCDALWAWWDARARSNVHTLGTGENSLRLLAQCAYHDGMVVKVPVARKVVQVRVQGKTVSPAMQEHFGLRWLFIPCPAGESEIVVCLA